MNLVKCPNCGGHGVVSHWMEFGLRLVRETCGWCQGRFMIDRTAWIPFQPHRQAPREFLDVRLVDDVEVINCWHAETHWTPMGEQRDGEVFVGPITDDRVAYVRMSKIKH